MSKIQVAVLRGGPSPEYDISLKTGATILAALGSQYEGHDIFISREVDPVWHRDGMPRRPEKALQGIDVVINALHGNYGEDGKVQKLLKDLGIPFSGSDPVASAIAMNKPLAKQAFHQNDIKTPYYKIIKKTDPLESVSKFVFEHFFLPFVVKPISAGSSVGVTIVKDFRNLGAALENVFKYSDAALIEEYIRGKEATVGVISNFRGEPLYALMPTEVRHGKDHFNFESKFSNDPVFNTPGDFTQQEKEELEHLAKRAHEIVGARHYSRSDFIVSPNRGIYILEINTQPSLSLSSSFEHALSSIGSGIGEFLDHLIKMILEL